jgi:hypothetical protein
MKATEIFVEQVLIGFLVMGTVGVMFYTEVMAFLVKQKDLSVMVGAGLVGAAYFIGIVYDRLADTILEDIDQHQRLWFALNPSKTPTDPFPENQYRVELMQPSDVYEYGNYLRSRIRLTRAFTTLLPGLSISVLLIAMHGTKPNPAQYQLPYAPSELLTAPAGTNLPPANNARFKVGGIAIALVYLSAFAVQTWRHTAGRKDKNAQDGRPGAGTASPVKLSQLWRLPKTHESKKLGNYQTYRDSHTVWRFVFVEPVFWAVAILALVAIVLVIGNKVSFLGIRVPGLIVWPPAPGFLLLLPLAGFVLTYLVGWSWWRISKTYRELLRDFHALSPLSQRPSHQAEPSSVDTHPEGSSQESALRENLEKVFLEELREIAARRGDQQFKDAKLEDDRIKRMLHNKCPVRPSTDLELIGLALSGGGVRSATFNLGVVQALHEHGVLPHVDYLSTVSGGGYIGCCISAILAKPTPLQDLPFQHTIGEVEAPAFIHLRNFSNYLAPGGTREVLRLPALVLQGLLTNLVSLLWLLLPFAAVLGFIFVWVVEPYPSSVSTPEASPTVAEALLTAAGGLASAADGLTAAATALTRTEYLGTGQTGGASRSSADSALPTASAQPGGVGHAMGRGNDASGANNSAMQTNRRTSRFDISAYLTWIGTFFLGLALCLAIVLPIGYRLWHNKQLSWQSRYTQMRVTAWTFYIFLAVVFLWLQPVALYYLLNFDLLAASVSLAGAGVLGVATTLATRVTQRIPGLMDKLLQVGLALLVPLTLWLLFLLLAKWTVCPPDWMPDVLIGVGPACQGGVYDKFYWGVAIGYGVLAVLLFLYFWFVVDVNVSSLHSFYRDRLSRAYLFDPAEADGTARAHRDRVRLQKLNDHKHAPYHLINAAVNIEQAKKRNMRGRNADAFLFSRLFTGSEITGYCKTNDLEAADDHIDLATAMAISGAAAAPMMGINTNRALRSLLALANVRLGYWMRNPRYIPGDMAKRKPGRRPKQYRVTQKYFFYELFGWLGDHKDHVYVTDGGHFDNLGAYELLRRRCRYIIVGDAEADPEMTFNGLAHLIRIARIDLGINITIDLNDLRRQPPGTVRSHCTIGKIDYGNGEVGEVLYIKSSIAGDENEYITEYRSRHPDFPHETTADQFFDEAQFEAYRALGHHIVRGLFVPRHSREQIELPQDGDENERKRISTSEDFRDWFRDLADWLQPLPSDRGTFVELQRQIAAIERRLAEPEFAAYSAALFPEAQQPGTVIPASHNLPAPEVDRRVLHLVNEQLQLMERAVLQLGLDDPRKRLRETNRGFMNLFRRWSQADAFRQVWAVSIANYSVNLQHFCEDALELNYKITWRDGCQQTVLLSLYEDGVRRRNTVPSATGLGSAEREYVQKWMQVLPPACKNLVNEFEWELILRHLWSLSDPNRWANVPKAPRHLVAELRVAPMTGVPTVAATAITFIAGFAIVQYAQGAPVLTYIRVRDTYRGLGLSSRLAEALSGKLRQPGNVTPRFAMADDTDLIRRLRFTLERLGYKRV